MISPNAALAPVDFLSYESLRLQNTAPKCLVRTRARRKYPGRLRLMRIRRPIFFLNLLKGLPKSRATPWIAGHGQIVLTKDSVGGFRYSRPCRDPRAPAAWFSLDRKGHVETLNVAKINSVSGLRQYWRPESGNRNYFRLNC
jgi:hypothetical protein